MPRLSREPKELGSTTKEAWDLIAPVVEEAWDLIAPCNVRAQIQEITNDNYSSFNIYAQKVAIPLPTKRDTSKNLVTRFLQPARVKSKECCGNERQRMCGVLFLCASVMELIKLDPVGYGSDDLEMSDNTLARILNFSAFLPCPQWWFILRSKNPHLFLCLSYALVNVFWFHFNFMSIFCSVGFNVLPAWSWL